MSCCFFKVIRQIPMSYGLMILNQSYSRQTVMANWIHWSLWNNAQSLKRHRRGALLFLEVVCLIPCSQGQGGKIDDLPPVSSFPDYNSNLYLRIAMKWHTELLKAWSGSLFFFEVIYQISRSHLLKIDLDLIWARSQGRLQYQIPQFALLLIWTHLNTICCSCQLPYVRNDTMYWWLSK